jgi:dUTP pyrophosphatase
MLRVARNPAPSAALLDELVDLWTAVSNAGGAVGFVPPVEARDVRPLAAEALERVRAGADDLVVARLDAVLVAFGFLVTNEWPLYRHWATVKRLQRHPSRPRMGAAGRVLGELEQAARDRGLERVVLTVRGGTGTERFYLRHGYRLDARLPERLLIDDGDLREELVMSKPLMGAHGEVAGRLRVEVRLLDADLPLPTYAHEGDAGLDLRAREDVALEPGRRAVVPTGVAVAIPDGYVGLVHPRSGLAARQGLGLVNAPGTVDAGYRGELKVVVVNHDRSATVRLRRGDRIAQLIVQRVERVEVVPVATLPPSARGEGGFGSTGR